MDLDYWHHDILSSKRNKYMSARIYQDTHHVREHLMAFLLGILTVILSQGQQNIILVFISSLPPNQMTTQRYTFGFPFVSKVLRPTTCQVPR